MELAIERRGYRKGRTGCGSGKLGKEGACTLAYGDANARRGVRAGEVWKHQDVRRVISQS